MSVEYEDGYRKIGEFREYYECHHTQRNEATTRLQLIDKLFFECLAWSQDDVISEERYNGEYADYTFLAPRRILIVEAKKQGTTFEFPVSTSARLKRPLSTLLNFSPELKAAIVQVSAYCQVRGVPYAAVTNGHQLVIFVAVRSDGTPPLEGQAIVFDSAARIQECFSVLWQYLSKPGVEQKRLETELTGKTIPTVPPKLSASLVPYPGFKVRNAFQADLEILADLIVQDLIASEAMEKDFHRECYCESGALSQHALVSKAILEARYHALVNEDAPGPVMLPANTRQGINPELVAKSLSRRPILLIGDVGVGKTVFLRHLINMVAAPLFEKALTFHINLGSQGTLSQDLKDFVPAEIARQLEDIYSVDLFEDDFVNGVYNLDLKKFEKSIYGSTKNTDRDLYEARRFEFLDNKLKQRDRHLLASLEHISKARRSPIVVFLDNADQRSDLTQQDAFLIAQEMAERWPVTVFLCLRPETFHRSLKIGALSGYHPKAFTIQPPRIGQVIEKRLRFALKIARGDVPVPTLGEDAGVSLTSLRTLIEVFLSSLSKNQLLLEFIENVTSGNVRLALDLVQEFFGSGHVNAKKIVDLVAQGEQYVIPLHEFVNAVIYGDCEHYDPQRSPLANIYDIPAYEPKEHFLLPLTLAILDAPQGANVDEGFVDPSVS